MCSSRSAAHIFSAPRAGPPPRAPRPKWPQRPSTRRQELGHAAWSMTVGELRVRHQRVPVELPALIEVLGREPERAIVDRIEADRAVVAPSRDGLRAGAAL